MTHAGPGLRNTSRLYKMATGSSIITAGQVWVTWGLAALKVVRPRCTTEPPSAFLSPLYSQFMPLFLPFIGSKSFWHFPTTLSLLLRRVLCFFLPLLSGNQSPAMLALKHRSTAQVTLFRRKENRILMFARQNCKFAFQSENADRCYSPWWPTAVYKHCCFAKRSISFFLA